MQWQTAPARWRVLFGKVAEKYRAGGRMQTEYARAAAYWMRIFLRISPL